MGLLAALKQLAVSFLVTFNWAYAFFSRRYKIHHARFARVDELAKLMAENLDRDPSLILGISHLNHILRVKPVKSRRELGNMLVVAPTRGGKGLLATAQLLSWRHSVVVNDIKGELLSASPTPSRCLPLSNPRFVALRPFLGLGEFTSNQPTLPGSRCRKFILVRHNADYSLLRVFRLYATRSASSMR